MGKLQWGSGLGHRLLLAALQLRAEKFPRFPGCQPLPRAASLKQLRSRPILIGQLSNTLSPRPSRPGSTPALLPLLPCPRSLDRACELPPQWRPSSCAPSGRLFGACGPRAPDALDSPPSSPLPPLRAPTPQRSSPRSPRLRARATRPSSAGRSRARSWAASDLGCGVSASSASSTRSGAT